MYLFIFPSTLFLLAYVNCIFVKKLIKKKKGGGALKIFLLLWNRGDGRERSLKQFSSIHYPLSSFISNSDCSLENKLKITFCKINLTLEGILKKLHKGIHVGGVNRTHSHY